MHTRSPILGFKKIEKIDFSLLCCYVFPQSSTWCGVAEVGDSARIASVYFAVPFFVIPVAVMTFAYGNTTKTLIKSIATTAKMRG